MGTRIHHDEHVLVCDGRKGFLLHNEGDATDLNLKVEQVFKAGENPSAAAQGADRPGRQQGRNFPTSAFEQTDWHQRVETEFVREVAEAINALANGKALGPLVVIAPPQALAEIRRHLHPAVTVKAELSKELTNLPAHEIENHLANL
ncbi:host attachment family protein [Rhodoligotrophos ferricapiens]|uniref:host attachment family protein n=1 Tax=Rhodoligotrophos ferricapiens TaxID=3069264 RepID=UPI00315D6AFB